MYFIAFFLQEKTHRAVPYKWIRGIELERLINYGLNRNKKFNVFWTENVNAFDENGVPKSSYVPLWYSTKPKRTRPKIPS